jgi:epoxyqueuosine reductase
MDAAARTRWVVEQARALGFDLCGVAPAEPFPELERLPEWLARGYAGEMRYLHDPRRASPTAAMPGARSVIVCAMNYNTPLPYSVEAKTACSSPRPMAGAQRTEPGAGNQEITQRGWISRYAWGDDYHEVLGEKLARLTAALRARFDPAGQTSRSAGEALDARWYVDTGPVVERVAAKYAGLGWLGKNTCLINEDWGSWLFLGVILTTLELAPSLQTETADYAAGPAPSPHSALLTVPDLCGQCTLCLEACPTGALVEPYVLDARRCISYLTIELRGPIPAEFEHALGWHVFGCDICQDVCPYNRRAPATKEARFRPQSTTGSGSRLPDLFAPPLEWLSALTEEQFRATFAHSAIRRTKHAGLVRNAHLAGSQE